MLIRSDEENPIDAIIEQMWKYNQTYTLAVDGGKAEDREPYWYIRDEFGSAIEHSDQPNARMVPFLSMIDGQMYTLLWLIEDVPSEGWILTRETCPNHSILCHFFSSEWLSIDYVCGIRDELIRRAKLVPWTNDDLSEDVNYQQEEPNEQYFNVNEFVFLTISLI